MSYQPLVSIIINTHNSVEYLKEAMQSALDQTYEHFELLVYDNASTKDVKSVVNQLEDPRIRFIRSEHFLTLGQARNEALKIANGELIDFLDADDIFLPQKLAKQVPLFENPKVGLAYSNTFLLQKENAGWKDRLRYSDPLPSGYIFEDLLKWYCISFDTAIFRKTAIGPDPSDWFPGQFNLCTDFDLFLKISHDYEIVYVDEGLSKWRKHGENWSLVKNYLDPAERFLMIPRILRYEPNLFKKHSKPIKAFLGTMYEGKAHYFWKIGARKEAWLIEIQAFLCIFRPTTLLKLFFIPWCSYYRFISLKQKIGRIMGKNFVNS